MNKAEELETGWLCHCGHYQDDDLHCDECGHEPPWGCDCSDCHDRYLESNYAEEEADEFAKHFPKGTDF